MTTASASGAARITGTGSPRSELRSEVLETPRTKRRRPTLNAFSAIEVLVPYTSGGSQRPDSRRLHDAKDQGAAVEDSGTPDFEERLTAFASPAFPSLRAGQRFVLSKYASDHLDTLDLGIEMPTGEGKTLLALLIADWALDQGRSVAYLTGTRHLAEQVEEEATKLGLDVVRFAAKDYGGAKLDDYHQAHAVGVMNYWVYFNSKPVPQPADLVIFDDAHLAEQPLSRFKRWGYRTRRAQHASCTANICNLVVAHTDAYSGLRVMHDGTAAPGTPPELLSFSDW